VSASPLASTSPSTRCARTPSTQACPWTRTIRCVESPRVRSGDTSFDFPNEPW
jgi:hypothetical protein